MRCICKQIITCCKRYWTEEMLLQGFNVAVSPSCRCIRLSVEEVVTAVSNRTLQRHKQLQELQLHMPLLETALQTSKRARTRILRARLWVLQAVLQRPMTCILVNLCSQHVPTPNPGTGRLAKKRNPDSVTCTKFCHVLALSSLLTFLPYPLAGSKVVSITQKLLLVQ
jgi:hypothetical protein